MKARHCPRVAINQPVHVELRPESFPNGTKCPIVCWVERVRSICASREYWRVVKADPGLDARETGTPLAYDRYREGRRREPAVSSQSASQAVSLYDHAHSSVDLEDVDFI